MVALAVVGVLLIGLLQTLNYHLSVASTHEARTITMTLAAGKLAEAREDPVAAEGEFTAPYQLYTFKTELGESKYPGIGLITVTVTGNNERAVLKELFRVKMEKPANDKPEETQSGGNGDNGGQSGSN
jgi:hypothetical protein